MPYLAKLGVSHIYASPLAAASPGSTHSYDVIDPSRLNPELGTEDDFARLTDTLHDHGMSVILDIVPNHMATTELNPWFRDVLTNGPASQYAKFFDIAWDDEDGKIVLPTLGAPLDQTIAEGHLEREADALRVYDRRFPLAPGTPDAPLEAVLDHQHYRLDYWRDSLPNYRRFFEIADLIGLRIEDPDVFEAVHALPLRLLVEHRIEGLRIDHIDGLRDPLAYLRRLRARANEASGGEPYIVVEKILSPGESLPDDWPVDGTTGYDFLGQANGLFADGHGLRTLTNTYRNFTGNATPVDDILYRRKRDILSARFDHELQWLSQSFARLAGLDQQLAYDTILELSACLPVYRTYVSAEGHSPTDAAHLAIAVEQALASDADPAAINLLRDLILRSPSSRSSGGSEGKPTASDSHPTDVPDQERPNADDALEFTFRWQQLTGPAMAKGLEDSTFYRYNRLISLNEVGGHADATTPAAFHRFIRNRARRWPDAMNGTSTHDTKRSEDVRVRLAGLSEEPRLWTATIRELAQTARDSAAPSLDANTEYHLWQAAIGCWPVPQSSPRGEEAEQFPERLAAYMHKAIRESAEHTSWTTHDESYEAAVAGFVTWLTSEPQAAPARTRIDRLVKRLDQTTYKRSIAQVVLKLTVPGVPDVYQGQELWDRSFVDPDNRRPVDYDLRSQLLDDVSRDGTTLRQLMRSPLDGRAKMFVTHRLLQLRHDLPDLFAHADYRPLVQSDRSLLAFARHLPDLPFRHDTAVREESGRGPERPPQSTTPRSSSRLSRGGGNPSQQPSALPSASANRGSPDQWLIVVIPRLFTTNPEYLNVPLPDGAPTQWRDILNGGETLRTRAGTLPVAKALRAGLPLVALPAP